MIESKITKYKVLFAFAGACLVLLAPSTVAAATIKCPDGKEFTVPSTLDTADRAALCVDNQGPKPAKDEGLVFCGGKGENPEGCPTVGGPGKTCGEGDRKVEIHINIGCQGKGNPIIDMVYALMRFLSLAVGLVLVGSAIVAGIQFTASGDEPQAKAKAVKRITAVAGAFLLYIMIFALLQFLVPGGLFAP